MTSSTAADDTDGKGTGPGFRLAVTPLSAPRRGRDAPLAGGDIILSVLLISIAESWLETSDERLRAAVDLQEAMLAGGMHRKPIPDLIIAAVAQAHDAVLVHHDDDFDDI